MIDTVEAGAGSYPDAPENKNKEYQFEFEASIKGYGYVYAKSEEEAKELIQSGKENEIVETYDMKLENITEIKEI